MTGNQYLRARYYNAQTGQFNRQDDFFGNHQDPQSFNKYAFVHGDPIQGIDPTGRNFSIGGLAVGAAIIGGLAGIVHGAILGFRDGGISGAIQRGLWEGAIGAAGGFLIGLGIGVGAVGLSALVGLAGITISAMTFASLAGMILLGFGAYSSVLEIGSARDNYEVAAGLSNLAFSLFVFRYSYKHFRASLPSGGPKPPPAAGTAEIPDSAFVEWFVKLQTGLWEKAGIGKRNWPRSLSWITNRDGTTGWGTSFRTRFAARLNSVRDIHPVVEEALGSVVDPSATHGKCGEPEAVSDLLYQLEVQYNIRFNTVAEARPYIEGARIQVRFTDSTGSQEPCSSCGGMLSQFGIIAE